MAKIKAAEKALGCHFPGTYRNFLRTFGGGFFGGLEFQYLTEKTYPNTTDDDLVGYTLRCREQDGEPDYIVTVYMPDFLRRACLDLRYVDEFGEVPIVHWAKFHTRPRTRHRRLAPDFGRFLLAKVRGTIALQTVIAKDMKAWGMKENGGSPPGTIGTKGGR